MALALLCGGCATGLRAGIGPTVDTRGRVGGHLYAGASFGFGHEQLAFEATVEAGGQAVGNPRGVAGIAASGLDVRQVGSVVSGRAGFRMMGGARSGPGKDRFWAGGPALAVSATLDADPIRLLGGEFRLNAVVQGQEEYGELYLGLTFEQLYFSDWDLLPW